MTNPTVMCTLHARPFELKDKEEDSDGTQLLIKEYWVADCGCAIEITFTIPHGEKEN